MTSIRRRYLYPIASGGGGNLLCHYKFDNNLVDFTGNEPTLSIVGSISYVNDRFGNPNSALKFNTTSSIVRTSTSIYSERTTLTIEYYALTSGNSQLEATDGNDKINLTVNNAKTLGYIQSYMRYFGTLSNPKTTGIDTEVWKKYAIVWSESALKLYINDTLIVTGATIASSITEPATLMALAAPYVNGIAYIDDFKVYDYNPYI